MTIVFQNSSVACHFSNQINEFIDFETFKQNNSNFNLELNLNLALFLLNKQNYPLFGHLEFLSNEFKFVLDKVQQNDVALWLLINNKDIEKLLAKPSEKLVKMKNYEIYQMFEDFISDVFNQKICLVQNLIWFVKKETYDKFSTKVNEVSKQTFGHFFLRNLDSIKKYIEKLEEKDNTFQSFNCDELNVFKRSVTPILSFGLTPKQYNNLIKMVNKKAFCGDFYLDLIFLGNKDEAITLIHHLKKLIIFLSQDDFLKDYVSFDINTIEHSPFYKNVDLYGKLMKNKDYQFISNFINNNHFMRFLNFNLENSQN